MEACAECVRQRTELAEEFCALRELFVALGDETRQQIFLALLESEQVGLRVGELTKRSHLSRPAVSHHLRILKDADLVRMHREGTRNYYYANADTHLWTALQALAGHVCAVCGGALEAGYPQWNKEEHGWN